MNLFQSKLNCNNGTKLPPNWNGEGKPTPDFVVSYNQDGTVASTYADPTWNLTAYHPHHQTTKIYFSFSHVQREHTAHEVESLKELRWIAFLMLWCRTKPQSITGFRQFFSRIRVIARLAVSRSVSLSEFFNSTEHLQAARKVLHPCVLQTLKFLLSFLDRLGPALVGFEVKVGSIVKIIQRDIRVYKEISRQNPVIPTRIYGHLLTALQFELKKFDDVAEQALQYAVRCADSKSKGKQLSFPPPIDVSDYLAECGLGEVRVVSALTGVQYIAKLQIQAFSGMRDSEARTLRCDCLKTQLIDGIKHYVIEGSTTKFSKGKAHPAMWVTSREGAIAINLAMKIAKSIYRFLNITDTEHLPLFVSTAYLATATRHFTHAPGASMTIAHLNLQNAMRKQLEPRLFASIEENDLIELESIDPYRAWRDEERFALGRLWVFMSHQLRRSLALYAQRSGLVSFPALKRQLQHVTEEMSRYYARGSAFAENFLKDREDHFGEEWQKLQPISAALSYSRQMLDQNETLFGSHWRWLDSNQRINGVMTLDREVTMKRFENGEMAYRETLLGGCISTNGCKGSAVNSIDISCVSGCVNLVGRLSNLERLISAQERFVSSLEPGSIEHVTESNDLTVLRDARSSVISNSAKHGS